GDDAVETDAPGRKIRPEVVGHRHRLRPGQLIRLREQPIPSRAVEAEAVVAGGAGIGHERAAGSAERRDRLRRGLEQDAGASRAPLEAHGYEPALRRARLHPERTVPRLGELDALGL